MVELSSKKVEAFLLGFVTLKSYNSVISFSLSEKSFSLKATIKGNLL